MKLNRFTAIIKSISNNAPNFFKKDTVNTITKMIKKFRYIDSDEGKKISVHIPPWL